MRDKQKNVTRNLKNHGRFLLIKRILKKLKKLLTFFIFYIKINLSKKKKKFFNVTYKNFLKKVLKGYWQKENYMLKYSHS